MWQFYFLHNVLWKIIGEISPECFYETPEVLNSWRTGWDAEAQKWSVILRKTQTSLVVLPWAFQPTLMPVF